MSNDIEKKQYEVEILKKVFGTKIDFTESEQPDFILEYPINLKIGVEVTELYYDGVSARLKKGEYIEQLLRGHKYWHKDDKKKLKVHEVTYYSSEQKCKVNNLPVLFLPKYSIKNYADALIHTIQSKGKKLEKYSSDASKYCMLIVCDRENQFKNIRKEDVAKNLFSNGISKIVRQSNFCEIYLVTTIDDEEKYIPLKAYMLLSDCSLFLDFIREQGLMKKLETSEHPLFGFAEVLKRRGCDKVLVGAVENDEGLGKVVVYNGRYGVGILLKQNNEWGLGLFDSYPDQKINCIGEFQIGDENDFFSDALFEEYEEITKAKIASIGLGFAVELDSEGHLR